jgi:thiol-disulfide isomerase/thioredoxin
MITLRRRAIPRRRGRFSLEPILSTRSRNQPMNATVRHALLALVGIAALGPVGIKATLGDEKAVKSTTSASTSTEVKLVPVKWDGYLKQVAAHKDAKLIVVDAWATWCGPCMKNFPHLVEMHHKYADKGLVAISLSLDLSDDPKKVAAAAKFLREKQAVFTNLILDETTNDAFDKLNTGTIPAVFVFTPDGKELKRFTLDDVDKGFTYDEVEAFVKDYLEGKAKK